MRNRPDHSNGHNPLDSYAKELFDQHPADSEFGIILRRGDARMRLKEILQAESTIKQQEELNKKIADNIVRQQVEHQLNMQYLIQFGVRADERQQFQQLLEQTAESGNLSLRQIANLTHVISQSNGSNNLSSSTTVLSGVAE